MGVIYSVDHVGVKSKDIDQIAHKPELDSTTVIASHCFKDLRIGLGAGVLCATPVALFAGPAVLAVGAAMGCLFGAAYGFLRGDEDNRIAKVAFEKLNKEPDHMLDKGELVCVIDAMGRCKQGEIIDSIFEKMSPQQVTELISDKKIQKRWFLDRPKVKEVIEQVPVNNISPGQKIGVNLPVVEVASELPSLEKTAKKMTQEKAVCVDDVKPMTYLVKDNVASAMKAGAKGILASTSVLLFAASVVIMSSIFLGPGVLFLLLAAGPLVAFVLGGGALFGLVVHSGIKNRAEETFNKLENQNYNTRLNAIDLRNIMDLLLIRNENHLIEELIKKMSEEQKSDLLKATESSEKLHMLVLKNSVASRENKTAPQSDDKSPSDPRENKF